MTPRTGIGKRLHQIAERLGADDATALQHAAAVVEALLEPRRAAAVDLRNRLAAELQAEFMRLRRSRVERLDDAAMIAVAGGVEAALGLIVTRLEREAAAFAAAVPTVDALCGHGGTPARDFE